MSALPVVLTTFHTLAGDTWTERKRYTGRDEAIAEGRARLDMEPEIRQFTVESMEMREGLLECMIQYRETAWRVPK